MLVLVEAGWDQAKALLEVENDFGTVPVWAQTELKKKIEDFGVMVNGREQDALIDTLNNALDKGFSIEQTAQAISDTFAEGYHIQNDSGDVERVIPTDDWSEMVARTELSRAANAGALALYQAADVQEIEYVTTEGSNVCDDCSEYDGQVYPIDEVPEIPQHPRCACGYMAADKDITDAYSGDEAA